jgi:hypothetical protein
VLSPLDNTSTTAKAAASVDTFAFDASKQLLDSIDLSESDEDSFACEMADGWRANNRW